MARPAQCYQIKQGLPVDVLVCEVVDFGSWGLKAPPADATIPPDHHPGFGPPLRGSQVFVVALGVLSVGLFSFPLVLLPDGVAGIRKFFLAGLVAFFSESLIEWDWRF